MLETVRREQHNEIYMRERERNLLTITITHKKKINQFEYKTFLRQLEIPLNDMSNATLNLLFYLKPENYKSI